MMMMSNAFLRKRVAYMPDYVLRLFCDNINDSSSEFRFCWLKYNDIRSIDCPAGLALPTNHGASTCFLSYPVPVAIGIFDLGNKQFGAVPHAITQL